MTGLPDHPDHPAHAVTVPVGARPYQGRRAGVVTRVAANAVDLGVVIVLVVGAYLVIAGIDFLIDPRTFNWPSLKLWGVSVIVFVGVPYLALSWCLTGRTFGDALFGLQVVNFRRARMNVVGSLGARHPVHDLPDRRALGRRQPAEPIRAGHHLRTSVVYEWAPHAASAVRQPAPNPSA